MVLEDQIKYYLPLHELDELAADWPNAVDLSVDDLFLISKVSAYSTDAENAVTVSKKLRYSNLCNRLSLDLDVPRINSSISYLSGRVDNLSANLASTSAMLCAAVKSTSSELSTKIASLSATVDRNFIKQYGTQLCNLILTSYVTVNGQQVLTADIAKQISLTNGKITDVQTVGVNDIFSIEGKAVAGGIISGDAYTSSTVQSFRNRMSYTTQNPCYLDMNLSVLESDASPSPLEVGIERDGTFIKIGQFNNPGGLPGTTYWNFYHAAFPLVRATPIVVKYADDGALASASKMLVTEFKFYGTASQADIDRAVPQLGYSVQTDGSKSLYKVKINSYGLVYEADKFELGNATTSEAGLVKLSSTAIGNDYGLTANADGGAYVNVPIASDSREGVIKLGATGGGSTYPVTLDTSNKAKVTLPAATSSRVGVVAIGASDTGTWHPLQLDSSYKAYVDVQIATTSRAGSIKVGNAPSEGEATPVYVNSSGAAYVKVKTQLNFSPTQKTSLGSSDKVLVNCTSSNLANYITYGNLQSQLTSNSAVALPVKDAYTFTQVAHVASSSDATCSCVIQADGFYNFQVRRSGEMYPTTGNCFCEIIVGSSISSSGKMRILCVNTTFLDYTVYLKRDTKVTLNAWTSASALRQNADRSISKVE